MGGGQFPSDLAYVLECKWLKEYGVIANYWERDALPLGVLQDCRLIMHAQMQMAPRGSSQPTQDLLTAELGRE